MTESSPKLGILAGAGTLPALLVRACEAQKRPYFVLGFEGAADPSLCDAMVRIGAVGEILALLKHAQVAELVMAGGVKRPKIASLRPDSEGARLLVRLGGAFFSGDNTLLSTVITYLEEQEFRVVGADMILSDLLAPEGQIGKVKPTKDAQNDIAFGIKIAHAIGALDIGQAVVVQQGYVLGVEAAEGTAELIARCWVLRCDLPHGGVLIKAKKPRQERRVDLPSIGVETIEQAAKAGLAGIAVEAGGALLLDRDTIIHQANALGIFIMGFASKKQDSFR